MTKSLYSQRDYIFGQAILALRIRFKLTQAALAEVLDVSRKAINRWEAGETYPKSEHLKALLTFAIQRHAFPAGHEEEEIRALWRIAHQKERLDELWLHRLLQQQTSPLVPTPFEGSQAAEEISTPGGLRVDWGEALDVSTFYGREEEQAQLSGWIVQERCRLVSLLGIGGIGKSALATRVMHQVARQFEVVIWHSLRDNPPCEALINECLQMLAPQMLPDVSASFERRLHLLMEQLRMQRVLLVLDNLEVLLEEGMDVGRMRVGFEAYTRLLQQIGETAHQSCLLLTSREKPAALVSLEGRRSPVRSMHLAGLDAESGVELLEEKDVVSPVQERVQLVEMYQGNPLALKIVAQTIVELFGGEIAVFLQQGEVVFGGVRNLLDEQFTRLSPLERTVLLWLAILREPVNLHDLLAVLHTPLSRMQTLEVIEGLHRRSLIEQGQRTGSFTLQSVVLEYATAQLISEANHEITQGQLLRLLEHGLCLAHAKEYVRQTQEHLLVAPLLALIQGTYQRPSEIEARLLWLLDALRDQDQTAQGYGPANLVVLLRMLRGHLRRLNLSRLALRGVFLQGTDMQDTILSRVIIRDHIFTEPLEAILTVTISRTGAYRAASTRRGEIRVWDGDGLILRHAWRAHTEMLWPLAFSPDERTLASASANGIIKLWDVSSGTLLWMSSPAKSIARIAFSPDGGMLASGGTDELVRLWDPRQGALLGELQHESAVLSLTWSPDGKLLASGCSDRSIWLWEPKRLASDQRRVRVLLGHTHWVTGLAFAPNGESMASASYDRTVKLWNVTTGACLQTLAEHTDRVLRVAWSPDGRTLASCSYDATIRLWDIQRSRMRIVLQGHTSTVTSVVFTPDSRTLLSGSYDGTLREWDVESGQSLRIIGGYTASLLDIDWSPDGMQLASCGADMLVTLWNTASGTPQSMLQGHRGMVQGVAWSPDGQLLASGGQDGIGLWNPATKVRLHKLQDPEAIDTVFQGVAWSPNGHLLACGSYLRGALVWETASRILRWVGPAHTSRIRRVAWSPDGHWLAGGDHNGSVYVWSADVGIQRWQLVGHVGAVVSVEWSPDGRYLASGGSGRGGGYLLVWEMHSGQRVHTLPGHSEEVSAIVWSPSGKHVISGDSDGKLRWWETENGQCLRVQDAHQGMVQALKVNPARDKLASCGDDGAIRLWDLHSGAHLQTLRRDRPYERLNITGIQGLSDAQKASLRALGAFEETGIDE